MYARLAVGRRIGLNVRYLTLPPSIVRACTRCARARRRRRERRHRRALEPFLSAEATVYGTKQARQDNKFPCTSTRLVLLPAEPRRLPQLLHPFLRRTLPGRGSASSPPTRSPPPTPPCAPIPRRRDHLLQVPRRAGAVLLPLRLRGPRAPGALRPRRRRALPVPPRRGPAAPSDDDDPLHAGQRDGAARALVPRAVPARPRRPRARVPAVVPPLGVRRVVAVDARHHSCGSRSGRGAPRCATCTRAGARASRSRDGPRATPTAPCSARGRRSSRCRSPALGAPVRQALRTRVPLRRPGPPAPVALQKMKVERRWWWAFFPVYLAIVGRM